MTTDCDNLPTVSVVIPNCNRSDLLRRCVEALAAQTRLPHEVFVVDDCSTDDTPDVLKAVAQHHPELPLRIIRNDTPEGANASRNRGIRAATGEIIAMLDNDSFAERDWLEHIAAAFADDDIAAVVGKVIDAHPRNLFDTTMRGTHHLPGPGPARRLVGCNMAVRRDVAMRFMLDEDRAAPSRDASGRPDVSVSGRSDEEGLYLMIRAAGLRAVVVPEAVVLHEHHHTGRSFLRQAWRGGKSAARLVYKYRIAHRIDLLPFLLGWITLPLALVDVRLTVAPAFFFLLAMAAITYNDLFLKRKTTAQTIITFPLLLVYYHIRLAGYVIESARLRLTRHEIQRMDLSTIEGEQPC